MTQEQHSPLIHPTRVGRYEVRFSYTFGLGGISIGLLVVLVITGLLLSFGYRPALQNAYMDATVQAPYPQFLRSLHRWSAYLLIISSCLHMVVVFVHGAYKARRRANWVIGVVLLLGVVALTITGTVLPWDLSAQATLSVVNAVLQAIPLLGGALAKAFFGPTLAATLLRAYVFHVILLPFLLLALTGVHLWRVRRDGLSEPEES
ncbi:MAG: cytochrome b N-terminal domain-containing protein [Acidimicrobiia bacterium]